MKNTHERRCGVVAILATAFVTQAALHADDSGSNAVAITADFPGGNVAVAKHEGNTVHVAPDLRGDRPWFYWCFEAKALQRPTRLYTVRLFVSAQTGDGGS